MARSNGASKIILLTGLLLFYCCKSPDNSELTIPVEHLKTGMLVTRMGNGFFSNQFRKIASKEQKFSHLGILSIENDTVFVYHAEANELTGIGSVKREEIHRFLNSIKVYEFYEFDYTDSVKNKIINEVHNYYENKTPFDLEFDSFKDDKLYCTELIATSVNNVLNRNEIQPTVFLKNKAIYGLDDIYLHKNVRQLCW